MRLVPRLPVWALPVLALLAGGASLFVFLRADPAQAPLVRLDPVVRAASPADAGLEARRPEQQLGGTYAGEVVDGQGRPIEGATVLLIRFEGGLDLTLPQFRADGSDFDPRLVPQLGRHEVADRTKTDAQGRFRTTAGARHIVQMALAFHKLYAPNAVAVGKPEQPLRITLQSGGLLKGLVLDPEGRPVSGALVEIYLQQIAPYAPNPEGNQAFAPMPKDPKPRGLSVQATLGEFLGRVLGPEAWGLDESQTEALRTSTASDGTFHFGPVDDSVQVQVVIHHPDFMWTDFDTNAEGIAVRPVLEPGKTLERTYRLETGNWIEGRVITDAQPPEPVGGVLIRLDHVSQYKQHPFYRDRARVGVTREDGTFRMSGLSWPPYKATLLHGSFGSQEVVQIPANTKSLTWQVKSRGGLEGTLSGLTERPPGGRVEVLLEPVGGGEGQRQAIQRERVPIDAQGRFRLDALVPGDYRVSVRAGALTGRPEAVSIRPREVARVTFDTGGGAQLSLRVLDGAGKIVDPATITLLVPGEPGQPDSARGTFTTRGGQLEEEGLVPGRYKADIWAPGFLPFTSEPFQLLEGRRQVVGPFVLRRPAYLRIVDVGDAQGRVPPDIRLEIQEGDGPSRPLMLKGDLALPAGPVTLRALSEAQGLLFESTVVLEEGRVETVHMLLQARSGR